MRSLQEGGLPVRLAHVVAPSDNFADWDVWLGRFVKALRRNRVDEVRTLLKSGARPHGAGCARHQPSGRGWQEGVRQLTAWLTPGRV